MKKITNLIFLCSLLIVSVVSAQNARLQVIHNSPDLAAALVDVYVNDDLLLNDFEIKNTLGKDGIEKWNYYIELKKKLRKTKDESEKNKIVEKILKIGKEYNFE